MKFKRAIATLSKLRYQGNIHILKTVYHFRFGTHLLYGVKTAKKHKINIELSETEYWKIAFKNRHESADPLYKNLRILKFQNLLRLSNCLLMCQLEQNKKLAATFPRPVYTKEKHNYNTRGARKNLLDIPRCQTFSYGRQSCKYQCIKDRNRLKKETQLRT